MHVYYKLELLLRSLIGTVISDSFYVCLDIHCDENHKPVLLLKVHEENFAIPKHSDYHYSKAITLFQSCFDSLLIRGTCFSICINSCYSVKIAPLLRGMTIPSSLSVPRCPFVMTTAYPFNYFMVAKVILPHLSVSSERDDGCGVACTSVI